MKFLSLLRNHCSTCVLFAIHACFLLSRAGFALVSGREASFRYFVRPRVFTPGTGTQATSHSQRSRSQNKRQTATHSAVHVHVQGNVIIQGSQSNTLFTPVPHCIPGFPLRPPSDQPCQDNLPLISPSPLYQSHPTGLFGYFPFHHPAPHLTIRGPIPIRC